MQKQDYKLNSKLYIYYKLYFLKIHEIIFNNIVSDPVVWGLVPKIQLEIAANRWI